VQDALDSTQDEIIHNKAGFSAEKIDVASLVGERFPGDWEHFQMR
jgi:hypothetical protein